MRKKKAPVSFATARAMSVFPVPGGPYSRMPRGGWRKRVNNVLKVTIQIGNLDANCLEELRMTKWKFHHFLDERKLLSAAANVVVAHLVQRFLVRDSLIQDFILQFSCKPPLLLA